MQDQFDADQPEDRREPVREEDQAVEQAVDEEVELPQAQQGEGGRGEDQVDVLGEAEDRRDGVDGEQHVGDPDRDDQDEQRRGVAASPHPGGHDVRSRIRRRNGRRIC